MKKAKIFTALSLLLLSITLMVVGVYAANVSKENMGVGGQITIPANEIGIAVLGYIGDADTDNDGVIDNATAALLDYNSSTNGDSWTFEEGDLVFDADGKETVEDVPKVVLTIKMTTESEIPVHVTFTPSGEGDNLPNSIIGMELYDGEDILSGTTGFSLAGQVGITKVIKIIFTLKDFLEIEQDFGFNYLLNFEEIATQ